MTPKGMKFGKGVAGSVLLAAAALELQSHDLHFCARMLSGFPGGRNCFPEDKETRELGKFGQEKEL